MKKRVRQHTAAPHVDRTWRLTKQRAAILEHVRSADTHPTAEAVYRAVQRTNKRISFGTVYRNLNFLAARGYIKEFMVDKISHYDGHVGAHFHCICERCGRISDVYDDSLAYQIQQLVSDQHFVPRMDNYQIRGLCVACAKKKPAHDHCTACGTVTRQVTNQRLCHACGFRVSCTFYAKQRQ